MESMKRLLALPAVAALVGCGAIPLPSQPLPDAEFSVPVALGPAQERVFSETPLFDAPVRRALKRVTVSGTATLNAPVANETRVEVLAVRNLPGFPTCVSQGGYRLCSSGGEVVGTITFAPGSRSAEFTLRSPLLDELAHAGQGYAGLRLAQGSLPANTTLQLRGMRAGAYL